MRKAKKPTGRDRRKTVPDLSNPTTLLTVEEVATRLRVNPSFLYEESRKGSASRFPFRRVGRFIRIMRGDLDRWLDQQAVGGPKAS
jgi:excisionase family DNA binding protein